MTLYYYIACRLGIFGKFGVSVSAWCFHSHDALLVYQHNWNSSRTWDCNGFRYSQLAGTKIMHTIPNNSNFLQAYGYKNYKRVGVVLQRGMFIFITHARHYDLSYILGIFILGLVLFPIMALWLNTESLLLLVQQTPCVAK